jgi:hypothetical protein
MDKEKKIEEKKPEAAETPVVEAAPVEEKKEEKKCEGKCCRKYFSVKMSVRVAVIIAAIIIAGALAFYCRGFFIAATVDGSPISRLSVINEAEKQSGKTILDNLILKKIVENEVARKHIVVTNAEVAAEIAKIEETVKAQGGTLDQALQSQGITRAELTEQITLQKKVEKLLPSAPTVSDAEIQEYIVNNKITIPAGKEAEYTAEVKAQMEKQKLNDAITALLTTLKEKASIQYFVNYQ